MAIEDVYDLHFELWQYKPCQTGLSPFGQKTALDLSNIVVNFSL